MRHPFALIHETATIGANCVLREHCKIGPSTLLSENCLIMAGVVIGERCRIGRNVVIANNTIVNSDVEIDDGARIGGLSFIGRRSWIGKQAFVGGAVTLADDELWSIPPFMLAYGDPCRLAGLNLRGFRRGKQFLSSNADLKLLRNEVDAILREGSDGGSGNVTNTSHLQLLQDMKEFARRVQEQRRIIVPMVQ